MRRAIAFGLALAGTSLAALADAADAGAPAGLPSCVTVATSSTYVPYGYNHVVTLANGCAKLADCTVATDVNPEPQRVRVAPRTTIDVTTYLGAAAQTFTARVSCQLR